MAAGATGASACASDAADVHQHRLRGRRARCLEPRRHAGLLQLLQLRQLDNVLSRQGQGRRRCAHACPLAPLPRACARTVAPIA
eukprot:scaffold74856_cov46-Phaeocystis_antarctica.AAC.1